MTSDENMCSYAVVIPLPTGEFTAEETLENSRMRQLINDLLRENISAFWLDENLTAFTVNLCDVQQPRTRKVCRGSVLVPFTGNAWVDAKIVAMATDYNCSSELTSSSFQIPVFYLLEPVSVSATKLVEPCIAQHFGAPVRYGLPVYLWIAEAGGFFSFEFLLNSETRSQLQVEKFNVFMWPYRPDPGSLSEALHSLCNKRMCRTVRTFVSAGGGYIGSCYGALAASSGLIRPMPLYSLRHAYLPSLQCRFPQVSYSLSDTLMSQSFFVLKNLYVSESSLLDQSHPLSFGINTTVPEFFSGPWFVWQGKKTQTPAVFSDFIFDQSNSPALPIFKKIKGSPSWVTSQFGEGSVVLFSSHPEFVNNISFLVDRYNWQGDPFSGRRVIHNALWYVTGEKEVDVQTMCSQPMGFLQSVCEQTNGIDLSETDVDMFPLIWGKIMQMNTNLSLLQMRAQRLLDMYRDTFEDTVFASQERMHSYTGNLCSEFIRWNTKTLASLMRLNKILNQTGLDENTAPQLSRFKTRLQRRILDTEEIINQVFKIGDQLEKRFEYNRLLSLKLLLVSQSRLLLRTFQICLKYIPQMYFSSEKLLRSLWYSYEADIAVAF